jgi:excisionase family DNA binding protein
MSDLPTSPERDTLLKIHQIAEEMKADEKTVYRRIQSGKLKAFKEGGRWMIWRSQLLAYLNGGSGHV